MQSRPTSIAWLCVLGTALVLSLAGCKKAEADAKPDASSTIDRKAPACAVFEGGALSATWTGCPDKMKREIRCATFVNDLKCDCYEDGVSKQWFTAKDPPLSARESATRVANTNCRWSLELP